MIVTEVRVKIMDGTNEPDRLLAFASVVFEGAFVVRDLKIIGGTKGLFVAMPCRKLTDRCHGCGCKNHLRARFCNQCGSKLDEDRATRGADSRIKLHADIAHPIKSETREMIQSIVLKAFAEERARSKLPGYVCTYDEFPEPDDDDSDARVDISDLTFPKPKGVINGGHRRNGTHLLGTISHRQKDTHS